jgi:hypothetical protein
MSRDDDFDFVDRMGEDETESEVSARLAKLFLATNGVIEIDARLVEPFIRGAAAMSFSAAAWASSGVVAGMFRGTGTPYRLNISLP